MTVAAIPVYVLYSHILVPVHIVGCPLSRPSTECNMVDEPACNPCPELLIRHGVFALVLLPHHTATVFPCPPPLFTKPEFLGLSALPPIFGPSVVPNPPLESQLPAAELTTSSDESHQCRHHHHQLPRRHGLFRCTCSCTSLRSWLPL